MQSTSTVVAITLLLALASAQKTLSPKPCFSICENQKKNEAPVKLLFSKTSPCPFTAVCSHVTSSPIQGEIIECFTDSSRKTCDFALEGNGILRGCDVHSRLVEVLRKHQRVDILVKNRMEFGELVRNGMRNCPCQTSRRKEGVPSKEVSVKTEETDDPNTWFSPEVREYVKKILAEEARQLKEKRVPSKTQDETIRRCPCKRLTRRLSYIRGRRFFTLRRKEVHGRVKNVTAPGGLQREPKLSQPIKEVSVKSKNIEKFGGYSPGGLQREPKLGQPIMEVSGKSKNNEKFGGYSPGGPQLGPKFSHPIKEVSGKSKNFEKFGGYSPGGPQLGPKFSQPIMEVSGKSKNFEKFGGYSPGGPQLRTQVENKDTVNLVITPEMKIFFEKLLQKSNEMNENSGKLKKPTEEVVSGRRSLDGIGGRRIGINGRRAEVGNSPQGKKDAWLTPEMKELIGQYVKKNPQIMEKPGSLRNVDGMENPWGIVQLPGKPELVQTEQEGPDGIANFLKRVPQNQVRQGSPGSLKNTGLRNAGNTRVKSRGRSQIEAPGRARDQTNFPRNVNKSPSWKKGPGFRGRPREFRTEVPHKKVSIRETNERPVQTPAKEVSGITKESQKKPQEKSTSTGTTQKTPVEKATTMTVQTTQSPRITSPKEVAKSTESPGTPKKTPEFSTQTEKLTTMVNKQDTNSEKMLSTTTPQPSQVTSSGHQESRDSKSTKTSESPRISTTSEGPQKSHESTPTGTSEKTITPTSEESRTSESTKTSPGRESTTEQSVSPGKSPPVSNSDPDIQMEFIPESEKQEILAEDGVFGQDEFEDVELRRPRKQKKIEFRPPPPVAVASPDGFAYAYSNPSSSGSPMFSPFEVVRRGRRNENFGTPIPLQHVYHVQIEY